MKKNKIIDSDKTIDLLCKKINKMSITNIISKKVEIRTILSKTKLSDITDDRLIDMTYMLKILSEYIYIVCNDNDERIKNTKIVNEMIYELVDRGYSI